MIGVLLAMSSGFGADLVAAGGEGASVEVVHRVNPRFPPDADAEAARCALRVEIDGRGRATAVEAFGCSAPFAAASTAAVAGWRWKPPEVDGVPARGRTLVSVAMVKGERRDVPVPDQCDHHLTVASNGTLNLAPADPAEACVAVFPNEAPLPPVPLSCSIDIRTSPDKERTLTLDRCPSEAHEWLEERVARATFARATWNTVWFEAQ